jgi:polysaccharide export outer membrane protein
VTVNVTTMGERLVSVEGQVTKAGAYPVAPDTTLLSAISMAQSPTRIAKLDDTVIFRTVDGQRMAALRPQAHSRRARSRSQDHRRRCRRGWLSSSKSVYRDVLTAAPIFNVFTRF